MAPSEIGKPGGPSWRRWSVVARNYLSCVLRMPELKEALLNVEKEKNPLGDDEYDLLGIDPQIGSEIHTFLIAKSDGDAAEIVEGTTGCHGAEAWRRLANHYDPMTDTRNLADRLLVMTPVRAKNLAGLPAAVTKWENQLRQHTARTGDALPDSLKVPLLLRTCPKDIEEELTLRMDSNVTYDQLKTKMIQLVHTRTTGVAPMYHFNTAQEPGCDDDAPETMETDFGIYSLVQKKGRPGPGPRKPAPGKKECNRCGRDNHLIKDCRAVCHKDGTKLPPKEKSKALRNLEEEDSVPREAADQVETGNLVPEVIQIGAISLVELCALDRPLDALQQDDPWATWTPPLPSPSSAATADAV